MKTNPWFIFSEILLILKNVISFTNTIFLNIFSFFFIFLSFSSFFSLDRCSIPSREVSILWSYLDITLLFSYYLYLIFYLHILVPQIFPQRRFVSFFYSLEVATRPKFSQELTSTDINNLFTFFPFIFLNLYRHNLLRAKYYFTNFQNYNHKKFSHLLRHNLQQYVQGNYLHNLEKVGQEDNCH